MATARLVQLSDLHLTARPGSTVFGSDVWRNLDRALARVRALPAIDRVVLTGDLANSARTEAYTMLAERLLPVRERVRLLPGNHDDRQRLAAAFPALPRPCADRCAFVDEVPGLSLVGLDSTVPRRARGELGASQLRWLRETVAALRSPWLLFLHHPPLRVGTWWLDKDLLRDREALAAVLATNPPRAIFAGHVHQEHHGTFAGVPVATAPAVAYQYAPRSWLPLPRARTPALRVIEVTDGIVTSRIEQP